MQPIFRQRLQASVVKADRNETRIIKLRHVMLQVCLLNILFVCNIDSVYDVVVRRDNLIL